MEKIMMPRETCRTMLAAKDAEIERLKRGDCCRDPWCGGECTCKICAPDLAIRDLEAELTTLRSRLAALEAEVARLGAPVSDGYYPATISDGEINALIHGHSFPGGMLTQEEREEADRRISYLNGLLITARTEGK